MSGLGLTILWVLTLNQMLAAQSGGKVSHRGLDQHADNPAALVDFLLLLILTRF